MGSVPGVVSTRAAWHEKLEVVEVSYLPSRLDFGDLVEHAKANSCTTRVFTTTDAQMKIARDKVGDAAVAMVGEVRESKETDQLYYLKRSHLTHLPLSPLQGRRVNGALGTKRDAGVWLSPRQQELAKLIQKRLEADADWVPGIVRPTELGEMASYEERLRARLEGDEK